MTLSRTASSSATAEPTKTQRGPRACDYCRSRKTRCDGRANSGIPCSNCVMIKIECVHSGPKKRAPKISYPEGYVESLESRVQQMSERLKQLQPDIDLDAFSPSTDPRSQSSPELGGEDGTDDEDDLVHVELTQHLQKLPMKQATQIFFGPSSAFVLLRNAMNLKDECTGSDPGKSYTKRLRYWTPRPWEIRTTTKWTPQYVYPPPDLIHDLVNNYFTYYNPYYPILHYPTFQKSLMEGLQLRDHQFGATVLLVCALGSRHSDDPRVFHESGDRLSAGWRFYEQIPMIRNDLFEPPTVYELQIYSLASLYIHSTNTISARWMLTGIGLRLCTENGIHRRKPEGHRLTVEDELKKRCFWVMMVLERVDCAYLGRPPMVHVEECDVELLTECDDQYWQLNGPVEFKHPPDVPCSISFFNRQIELTNTLEPAIRYLYPNKKAKFMMRAFGEDWEKKLVEELDRNLDEWTAKLPEHLRWDPERMTQNIVFFTQSAILQSLYCYVQLQIHRPSIHKPSTLSARSLSICASCSRECIKIIDAQIMRSEIIASHTLPALFMSGIVVLVNIWGAQRSGLVPVHEAKEWADIETCLRICKRYEERYVLAARFYDFFQELTISRTASLIPTQLPPMSGYTPLTPSHPMYQYQEVNLAGKPTARRQVPPGTDVWNWGQSSPSTATSNERSAQVPNWNTPVGFNLENWGTYLADNRIGKNN